MHMGLAQVVTSEQGGEFVNYLNKQSMDLLGIKHHLSTAYHLQAGVWKQPVMQDIVR